MGYSLQGDILSVGGGLTKTDGNGYGQGASQARVRTGTEGGDGAL